MKKLCILSFILLVTLSFSWVGHSYFTYLIVFSTPNFDPNKLVQITDYSYTENRSYTTAYSTSNVFDFLEFSEFLKRETNSAVFFDESHKLSKAHQNQISVWQILATYVYYPDLGIDTGIADDFLGQLAVSTAKTIGVNINQSFRHSVLKYGTIEIFGVHESFIHFIRMSQLAKAKNDRYWQLRFLAYALHYMEDLFAPYHVKLGEWYEVAMIPFDRNTLSYLNTYHTICDNYLLFLLTDSAHSEEVRKIIQSAKPIFISKDQKKIADEVLMYAYVNFSALHSEIKTAFTEALKTGFRYELFKEYESAGKLDRLYKRILPIIETMSGVLKGVIQTFN